MDLSHVTVAEGGHTIWQNSTYIGGVTGITSGTENQDYVLFEAESGSYAFKVSGSSKPL